MTAGTRVHFPHRGTSGLVLHAVLGRVAVGSNSDVEVGAVRAGDQVLGPMVIDQAGRQVDDLGGGRGDACRSGRVRKAQHRVRIGYVQLIADERHPERRMQALEEYAAAIRDAAAVSVAQQGDAIGAGRRRAGAGHDLLHDPTLEAFAVVGLVGRIGLRDQHVAVGQDVEPARMREPGCECGHARASCSRRLAAGGPSLGRSNVHRRQQRLVRHDQLRLRAEIGIGWQLRQVGACRQQGGQRGSQRGSKGN